MPALVQDERIYETSTTTGTGEYTLAGAVTGFQPASVIGANNYLIGFVTDDTNWEAGIYTYVTGPDRLQRTAVVASSNGDAAVDWGSGTKKLRCGPIAYFARGRRVSKSVAGSANVTLTALEQRCDLLELTGVLTGNIEVIVDTTKAAWLVKNSTTGNFTINFKTSAGTGVKLPQGLSIPAFCDGTNVLNALAGLFEKTTVASATTPDIWTATGPLIDYTGTTAATGFAQAPFAGARRTLLCAAACSFTAGANLLTPGSVNITAAAGDLVTVHAVTTTQFRIEFVKADGTVGAAASDTVAGRIEIAVQSEMEAGTDVTRAVTPGRQQYHPSAAKGWCQANVSGSAVVSYNTSSVTDGGPGDVTFNWNVDFSGANFVALYQMETTSFNGGGRVASLSAGATSVIVTNYAGAATDPASHMCAAFGDQA